MVTVKEGALYAQKKAAYAVIVSRFNEFISQNLLDGALDSLKRRGVKEDEITVIKVPGSFEIPTTAKKIAPRVDAIICLGVLIRGDTPHFDFLSAEVTKGVATVSLDTGKPVINGVITAETIEQAIERAGTKQGNKGFESAALAVEMVNLYRTL